MREHFEKKVRESNPSLALERYADPITASEFGRKVGDYRAPMARELWKGYQMACEPTHHAVIDEYGEIIYARRISGLLDTVEQCEYYIEQCRKDPVTRHSAKGWTVKEVTLHD